MATRADKNNNPGNIKASDWSMALPGVVGVEQKPALDGGHFLIFDNPQSGFNAMKALLTTGRPYQGKTAEAAIKTWNGGGAYGAADVGLNPHQDIQMQLKDPNKLNSVVLAMAKAEGFGGGSGHMGKKSYHEFAQAIKAQYPQYANADDLQLAQEVLAKYPQYASQVAMPGEEAVNTNFAADQGGGFNTNPAPVEPGSAAAGQANTPNLAQNAATLGSEVAEKANKGIGWLNQAIKDPGMATGINHYLPGELAKAAGQTLLDPELKGIASGVRAIEATPETAKAVGGLLKDLFHKNLVDEKGNKVGIGHAIAHPFTTYVPSAAEHVAKADSTMKKPVQIGPIQQKTMAGDSTAGNLKTATVAALQAAGAKDPGIISKGLSDTGGLLVSGAKGIGGLVGKGLGIGGGLGIGAGLLSGLGWLAKKALGK